MGHEELREIIIKCELWPRELVDFLPEPRVGSFKRVYVKGLPDVEFWCFTEAHEGQDHVFRTQEGKVSLPWDLFQHSGKKVFLPEEVTWQPHGGGEHGE